MAPAPEYESRVRGPQAGNLAVGTQPIPQIGESAVGAAAAQLGQVMSNTALVLEQSQQATRATVEMNEYLRQIDELETRYARDTDYQNAPKKFEAEATKLRETALANARLSPQKQEEFNLRLERLHNASSAKVKQAAFTRETDDNQARLSQGIFQLQTRYAKAGSEAERLSIETEAFAAIDQTANAGWISQRARETLRQNWNKERDQIAIMRGIRDNPEATALALKDGKNFPDLDPLLREQYINQAQNSADVRISDQLTNEARFNPSAIALRIGRAFDASHAVDIFDRGIIKVESGGKGDAVSNKGALGLAQVMPETAREVLRKLGRADVADLPEADLKKKMLEDPVLNRQVGLTYFQSQVAKFNGSYPLALAAYNAGPTRVEGWHKKAVEKFGDNYSPAQFASVVPIKETQEYILKVYGAMGVSPEGVNLSPHKLAQVTTLVGNEINAQNAATASLIKSLADTQRSENNIVESYKAGFSVDPETESAWVSTQRAAAQAGDAGARKALREYEIVKAHAPFIRDAWRMPLAVLEAQVRGYETQLAQAPNVTSTDKTRLDAFRAVLQTVKERRNEDPRALGERAGLFNPVAIDPNFNPADTAAQQTLTIAGRQALLASNHYGGEIKVFRPLEADAIKARVVDMVDADKAAFVNAIVRAMPDQATAQAALKQVGVDAKTVTAASVAGTRPDLLREIMAGNALLKDEAGKPKAIELRNVLANTLGGQLWADTKTQGAVTDAALAIYVARRGKDDALYGATDTAELKRAIEDVAGQTTFRGGKRVAAPPSIGARNFGAMLDNLDSDALLLFGGAYDRSGQPFDPAWLGKNAQLKQRAPGSSQYGIFVNDALVVNYDMQPLLIDADRLAEYFQTKKKLPAADNIGSVSP